MSGEYGVAAFIGNPPMNLLPCHMDTGRIVFDHECILDIFARREPWGAVVKNGKNTTLGIRPENIALGRIKTPGAITGRVYAIQPFGGEWLVVLKAGVQLVSVRLFQGEKPMLESIAWLKFDLDRIFLYDSDGKLLK